MKINPIAARILLNSRKAYAESNTINNPWKRDIAQFSKAGLAMSKSIKPNGTSRNRAIDSQIDIEQLFEEAKKFNHSIIDKTGSDIDISATVNEYTDYLDICRRALTKKYTILLNEAQSHPDPVVYINDKYKNKNSPYYTADLTDEERNIAYRNELNMLKNGKLQSTEMYDSLFRNIKLNGPEGIATEKTFERQLVNKQLSNLLQKNNISLTPDEEFTFSVDPYGYEVTVHGSLSDEKRLKIQSLLNEKDYGCQLFRHINRSTQGLDVETTQRTGNRNDKYCLYLETKRILGIDIRDLEERDGTYYTTDGKDIISLYCKAVDAAGSSADTSLKPYFKQLVHDVASRGWNNVPDMVLSMKYSTNQLYDMHQKYGFHPDNNPWLDELRSRSTVTVF